MKSYLHFVTLSPNPSPASGRGEARGFTLLEMLVVLVVASIMLTVVTLNLMPNAQTVLREESQRLALLMEN
ncbi:MAG: prepilin-type N-terminal cleavage/methylation domain-containing protein, partial [Pseudomonadota bacterium]